MTTIKGCYACGEANFSDHGANRLGASALMQGLADGYFVLPYTIGNYLADEISTGKISTDAPEFVAAEDNVRKQVESLFNNNGTVPVDHFHRKLGKIMWDYCARSRLYRFGRVDVQGRFGKKRVLWWSLPRGIPNRRRRSLACR
jgi:succinate dehydrogenase / fumarate reductase flavoprotein subunit